MANAVVVLMVCGVALVIDYLWGRFAYHEFFVKGRSEAEVARAVRLRSIALALMAVGLGISWAGSRLVESTAVQLLALLPLLAGLGLLFRASHQISTGRALLALGLVITGGALCVLALAQGWLPGRWPFDSIPAGKMILVTIVAGGLFLMAARLSRPPQS